MEYTCWTAWGDRRRVRINPVPSRSGDLGTGAIPTRHPSRPGRSPNADYTQHKRVRSTASCCAAGWGPHVPVQTFLMIELREFQREFIAGATADGVDTAVLSTPRGNGKSSLAGHLVTRILTPADPLFVPGSESVLGAASIEQARIVFRFARADLEPTGEYRFLDSYTRIGITHRPTNTKLRVIGSNGKTSMGLVGCPWAILDEPGSWGTRGGELMNDAIETAKGKPGSPLRAMYVGTLAPAKSGWWHDLVHSGTHGSAFVMALRGDPERWSEEDEIRRVNPLTQIDEGFLRKLLSERDAALRDSRLRARFRSYRLNVPTSDESENVVDDLGMG